MAQFTPNLEYIGAGGELTTAEEALVQAFNSLANSPAGQFIRKTGASAFENSTPGIGSFAINDLNDVIISSPLNSQVLQYNGTNWVNTNNVADGITSLGGLTSAIQTFVNDTNVTISSAGAAHTLGWSSTLSLARGGTAAALTASNGGIFYSTATAGAILAGTATAGQILRSGASAAPAWSTATYPATAGITAGMFLRSDGTNFGNSTLVLPNAAAISTLLYASSADTISALATANSGVLVTGGTGIPSIATDIPTAVTIGGAFIYRVGGTDVSLADGGTNASLTASNGGIFYSTATAGAILAGTATAGQMLQSGVTAAPIWSTSTYPATNAINTLLFASSANVMAALATANSAVLVTSSTGVPSLLGSMTSGQLVVGSTGATPVLATLTGTAPVTITNGAGTITVAASAASDTASGVVELATIAETNTGTDTVRAVTPDGISGATRTIILSAAGGWPPTTAGSSAVTQVQYATNLQNLQHLDFDAATRENAQWTLVMPDSWDAGTITATFYWTSGATSGDVIWGIEGRSYGDNEAVDATWGTAQTVTDTATAVASSVRISAATAAVTLAGTPAGSEAVQIRIFRDAAAVGDTMAGDARLIAIKIEYVISSYSD
jgi:hypothetical protein